MLRARGGPRPLATATARRRAGEAVACPAGRQPKKLGTSRRSPFAVGSSGAEKSDTSTRKRVEVSPHSHNRDRMASAGVTPSSPHPAGAITEYRLQLSAPRRCGLRSPDAAILPANMPASGRRAPMGGRSAPKKPRHCRGHVSHSPHWPVRTFAKTAHRACVAGW